MRSFRGAFRWVVVTVSVIVLTSFTVDATLSPNGFSQSALGILASRAVPPEMCPEGMVLITESDAKLCVDRFEASPSPECPDSTVDSALETRVNIDASECRPHAAEDEIPWVYVTFHQAKELCAKAGKRLPTSEEWYLFSLGTPDNGRDCNTSGASLISGEDGSACVNGHGIFDAIGNAWEWVDAEVVDGSYNGRVLPDSGYVLNADRDGIATLTNPDTPSADVRNDYFWSEPVGHFGILRGGFYGSGTDGGLYSVQAKTPYSLASAATGFRCVTSL